MSRAVFPVPGIYNYMDAFHVYTEAGTFDRDKIVGQIVEEIIIEEET